MKKPRIAGFFYVIWSRRPQRLSTISVPAGTRFLPVIMALIERPGGVETKRPQVARENFHGCDSARLDGIDEVGSGGEGEIFSTPKSEPLRIGEVVN